jgi:hypothetical protein
MLRHDDDATLSATETDDASSPLLRASPSPRTSVTAASAASSSSRNPGAHRHRHGLKRDLKGGTFSASRLDTNANYTDGGGDGEHDDDDYDYYSYAYAYGPAGGLAGLRANTYALRCAVFASIGGLTFGYDQGVIANVLVMDDFVARWPVGPWERGLMSTSPSQFRYLVFWARETLTAFFFFFGRDNQLRCSSWDVCLARSARVCWRIGVRGGRLSRLRVVRVVLLYVRVRTPRFLPLWS